MEFRILTSHYGRGGFLPGLSTSAERRYHLAQPLCDFLMDGRRTVMTEERHTVVQFDSIASRVVEKGLDVLTQLVFISFNVPVSYLLHFPFDWVEEGFDIRRIQYESAGNGRSGDGKRSPECSRWEVEVLPAHHYARFEEDEAHDLAHLVIV